jgi:hypothetical protein
LEDWVWKMNSNWTPRFKKFKLWRGIQPTKPTQLI